MELIESKRGFVVSGLLLPLLRLVSPPISSGSGPVEHPAETARRSQNVVGGLISIPLWLLRRQEWIVWIWIRAHRRRASRCRSHLDGIGRTVAYTCIACCDAICIRVANEPYAIVLTHGHIGVLNRVVCIIVCENAAIVLSPFVNTVSMKNKYLKFRLSTPQRPDFLNFGMLCKKLRARLNRR